MSIKFRELGLKLYRRRGQMHFAAAALLFGFVAISLVMPAGSAPQLGVILWTSAVTLGVVSVVLIYTGKGLLPERECVEVAVPVRGRWLAMNSPETKVPSHGIRMYGQAFAVDLVYEPHQADRPVFGSGSAMRAPSDYPAFGEPVFAMIDGVVVRSSDWRRDHRARSNIVAILYMSIEGMVREFGGSGFILGNHVTIRGDDGVFATIAHLQQGSAMLRVGQTVRAGEQIGRCGNSGNSSEPHVHAQLMDRESPWTAQGIPMLFKSIVVEPAPMETGESTGNGFIEGTEPTSRMPANGEYLNC